MASHRRHTKRYEQTIYQRFATSNTKSACHTPFIKNRLNRFIRSIYSCLDKGVMGTGFGINSLILQEFQQILAKPH